MKRHLIFIPPTVFLFILPFTHTVALRLFSLALTGVAALWVWRRSGFDLPPLPLKIPLIIWAVIAALSLLYAVNPGYSIGELKNEIGYTMIAFVSFFVLTRDRRSLTVFLVAVMASTAVLAFMGIGTRIYFGRWYSEGYQDGVGGFSTVMILVLPFLGFAFAFLRSWLAKLLVAMLITAAIVAAYLTLNRAFWPAFLTSLVLFLGLYFIHVMRMKRHRIGATVVAAIVVGAVVSVNLFQDVVETKARVTASASLWEDILSKDIRLEFWDKTLVELEGHEWTGAGFGRDSFRMAYPELRIKRGLWHAHNMFLNYWAQMGVPGLLALVLLLGAIIERFWRIYRSDHRPELVLFGAAALAMAAGFIIKNMTDDFFYRHIALLFWSLVGMTLGYWMHTEAHGDTSEEADVRTPSAEG